MKKDSKLTRLAKLATEVLEKLYELVPSEWKKAYEDIPIGLILAFIQELEKVASSGAEKRINLCEEDEDESFSDEAIGYFLGTLPHLLKKSEIAISQIQNGNKLSIQLLKKAFKYAARMRLEFSVKIASTWSLERQKVFNESHSRAFSKSLEAGKDYAGQGQNFYLYLFLCIFWPYIKHCKNVTELYDFMSKLKLYFGDEQSFRRLCSRLGIKLRLRGRPLKNRTLL